jgi:hypothetical protein
MRSLSHAMLVFIVVFAVSCGRPADVHWSDGNFEVYAIDMDFTATMLGYNHHPGILGLVDAEVVAAGSTAQWVYVERNTSGRTEFYIVPKEGMPENYHGTVEGPFSETQFRELRTERQLQDFTWRKKK